MTHAIRALLAALVLSTVTIALAPKAQAHYCQADAPATDCGSCTSGSHYHEDRTRVLHCRSGICDPTFCLVCPPNFIINCAFRDAGAWALP